MTETSYLGLPLIAAAQAQKHVTHNQAIAAIDAMVHLAVIEKGRNAPPSNPAQGDRYLVGGAPTGLFSGKAGNLAHFDEGLWRFYQPRVGWRAYIQADSRFNIFDGTIWRDVGFHVGELGTLNQLGVGTSADSVNRLAVKTNAALITARTLSESGTGDLRFVMNKEAATGSVSHVFQTGFSGRAEIGLTGDNDLRVKVSSDGTVWRDAVQIARATGIVSFPQGVAGLSGSGGIGLNLLANAELVVNQRLFAGGALAAGVYGFDRWKAGTGGCTLTRATNGTITLTGPLIQVIELPGLASAQVTFSIESPSATLTVDIAGVSGTITAGSGRRSITLIVPAVATGNITVTLSGTAVSFARPMLTVGSSALTFQRVPLAIELAICQRYFCKTYESTIAPGAVTLNGAIAINPAYSGVGGVMFNFMFPAQMRATPTVTVYSTGSGAAGFMRRSDGVDIAVTFLGTSDGITTFYNGVTTLATAAHFAHIIANAEL
jgi:hypothetical protein